MIKSNLKASQSWEGGNKGFTLVELLAVIVILAILVIIAVPSVIKMLNNTKKNAFSVEAENIIKSAKNAYSNRELNGEEKKYCYSLIELSEYVDKDFTGYTGSVYIDPSTDTYKIWLSKDDFIINGNNSGDINVVELTQIQPASLTCEDIVILACTSFKYNLYVNAYSGEFSNHQSIKYYEMLTGATQEVEEPTRNGYTFSGWQMMGTPTSFQNNILEMGEGNVILIAEWTSNVVPAHRLYVNPNGGAWDGFTTTQEYIVEEYKTKLISNPIRHGYIFDGWVGIEAANSFLNNLLEMREVDVSLEAKWVPLYTYTGTSILIDDGNGNWRIKFLTSGTLRFAKNPGQLDVFCVGGGGAGE